MGRAEDRDDLRWRHRGGAGMGVGTAKEVWEDTQKKLGRRTSGSNEEVCTQTDCADLGDGPRRASRGENPGLV